MGEILRHSLLNRLADLLVFKGLVNNDAELGASVSHETVDVLIEILVVNDSLDFFSHGLHVSQKFFEVVLEFNLGGLELQAFF